MNEISSFLAQTPATPKMPLLFLGHGSPMNAVDDNEFVQGFRKVASEIALPSAILCISAHWETRGTYVTAMQNPRTIHDFGGFPKELYEIDYPAPGYPELAEQTRKMIKSADVVQDHQWGLDHGAWTVLRHMYPKADVPVIQLSLNRNKTPEEHYQIAGELQLLREKGVLIIGSGNLIHNLGMVDWRNMNTIGHAYDWAETAREKMNRAILDDNHRMLIDYRSQGRELELSVPTPEHFLPLLYVLALKQENESVQLFNDKALAGSLTMTSVRIG